MDSPALLFGTLFLAAFFAGIINAIAGGGTLLTFPALVAALKPDYGPEAEALANTTSTVALLPGSLAGTWGYRKEFAEARDFALRLIPPSLVGGFVGSILVLSDKQLFGQLVPWLILTAAVLFLIQHPINRYLKRDPDAETKLATGWKLAGILAFQFSIAVYGGYFGAGIGILMLTALSVLGVGSIHRANAVKTLLATVINGTSAIVFALWGHVDWGYAGIMAAGAVAGGYAGARTARRLPAWVVRWVVIAIGFGLAGYYIWKNFFRAPT